MPPSRRRYASSALIFLGGGFLAGNSLFAMKRNRKVGPCAYPAAVSRTGGDDLHRPQIPAAERDRRIVELRRRGWTYKRIGRAVGMSENGVAASLTRIRQGRPGRAPR